MPDKEAIEDQLQLLAAYRRTLLQYLKQQAVIGTTYIQPSVAEGIHEARQHIKRIKNTLKSWGVDIEDWPDDEALPEEMPPPPIRSVALRSTVSIWRYWPVMIAIGAIALIFLDPSIIPLSLFSKGVTPAAPPATDSSLVQLKGFTIAPNTGTLIAQPQGSPQSIALQIAVASPEMLPAQLASTDPPTAAPPSIPVTLPTATAQAVSTDPPVAAQQRAPTQLPTAAAQAAPTEQPVAASPIIPTTLPPTTAHSTLVPISTPNSVPTLAVINSPQDAAKSGLRVVAVQPLSPAAQAGFRVGQILLSLNGQATQDVETARSIIAQNKGKPITAIVLDDSILLTLVVTPGEGDLGIELCGVALCP